MTMKKTRSIVSCVIVQLCVGIIYLWSVFNVHVQAAFQWSETAARMVSPYMMLAYVLGNFLGGMLNDKKGPKLTCLFGVLVFSIGIAATGFLTANTISLIYLTYCGMGGFGSGMAYGACISCIQKWLPDKRGLAAGIAVASFGMSTVIFAPVFQRLVVAFMDESGIVNFRGVFLLLGVAFCVIGLTASACISVPEERDRPTSAIGGAGRDYRLREAIRTAPFWCMFFYIFFSNGTWNLVVPLIKDLGMERGLSEAAAVLCVSVTGIASTLGRLGAATISDYLGRIRTVAILTATTFAGALLLSFANSWMYFAVVALVAFCFGGPCATNAAINTDFFGTRYSGTVYGVMMLALGLSSVVFNLLAEKLLNGSSVQTFLMAAGTAAIALGIMLALGKIKQCEPWSESAS